MAAMNPVWEQQFGKLVALEGNQDTVATQLRLLPPSPKILVLPPLSDNLSQNVEKQSFDARAFIRHVYSTFTERTETARSFLMSSSSTHPRLVFMNGGSVCARTTCITAIRDNLTNGSIEEAETIFNGIVEDGVAGLMKHVKLEIEEVQTEAGNNGDKEEEVEVVETVEDPVTRAMKAADSLDRETAVLQSENDTVENDDYQGDQRFSEVYTKHVAQSTQDTPEAMDSPRCDQGEVSEIKTRTHPSEVPGDDIVTTVVTMQTPHTDSTGQTPLGLDTFLETPSTAWPESAVDLNQQTNINDDDEYDEEAIFPTDPNFVCRSPTPGVIYGEACIVDVQTVSPIYQVKGIRRVKSAEIDYQVRPGSLGQTSKIPQPLRQTASAFNLNARRASADPTSKESPREFQTLPRATFVRASQTTIRRSPTTGRPISSSSQATYKTAPPRIYVDRGTDADEIIIAYTPEQPFEPVFPVVEDLVIHFDDYESKEIFESVVRSYKNGSYPVFPSPPESVIETPASPSRTITSEEHDEDLLRHSSHCTAETDDFGHERLHAFDPCRSDDPFVKRQWPQEEKLQRMDSKMPMHEPPTPSMTPPPSMNKVAERFVTLSLVDSDNVISLQNSFRELLGNHFPTGENGFSQNYYSSTPEMERLWKPVLRNDQNSSGRIEGRNVDQIIALGSDAGVKSDFFNQVSGQLEKLGTKRDGVNKSAKVNVGYLIANVMQSFSCLPLTTQSTFNPLSNPALLATLLVPQLESYLASNNSTRLLILQFSSTHLATVLALRRLLGEDLFKIAGILDSLASDPPSILSSPRRSLNANPLSNDAVSSRAHSRPPLSHTRGESERSLERQVRPRPSIAASLAGSTRSSIALPKADIASASFSKADYLIPSIATDTEITTFLSGIWTSLMEQSPFYTPEPEPEPVIVEKIVEKVVEKILPRKQARLPTSSFRHAGHQSKISRLTGSIKHGYSPSSEKSKHGYAPSIASTVKTTKTTASEKSRRDNLAWENFYIAEEDSDDDAYDRMILGRGFAKIRPETPKPVGQAPIRPKKKALKWLGLA
ncbi:hypothetical protein LSUE1_G003726 [Lachnellula suecica]|uniref:Gastric mucin-like protein n=1 Tax=Lachnellula suecica TaxID=602035 RepID=A0A8T9CFZ5_9HELO|nr:hypothetical protein LSUE1_G003726 [Lachnellula suecica]